MAKPTIEQESILVRPSSALGQLYAALRHLVPILITYALARGMIANDTAALITGVVGILGPVFISQYNAWVAHRSMYRLAADPNTRRVAFRRKG